MDETRHVIRSRGHTCSRLLILVAVWGVLSACGVPSTGRQSTAQVTPAPASTTPVAPPASASPAETPVATASGSAALEHGILYEEYAYFMLEGIAPMGGYYTPIEQRDLAWTDMRDPQRYHRERYFQTQESPPRDGLASYDTGTGAGGSASRCSYVEDTMTCQQQPITDTLTFADWSARRTRWPRQYVENRNDPAALQALNGSVFKGIQTDPEWGEVYVFERRVPIVMSDRYQGQEGIETYVIDRHFRRIEERVMVLDGGQEVLHEQYRLTTWEILDPADVPAALFDPDRVPDGTFTP